MLGAVVVFLSFFLVKKKTAYEMRISGWSSDVCSSDLHRAAGGARDDGAAAEVEEGGILQSRVAATHGVCPRKGVSVQARYEDTGQTVSRPLQGERLRGAEPARWVVRKGGLEPPRLAAPAPKAGASTSSATLDRKSTRLNSSH